VAPDGSFQAMLLRSGRDDSALRLPGARGTRASPLLPRQGGIGRLVEEERRRLRRSIAVILGTTKSQAAA
jgi:hypothetical protein